MVAVNTNIHRLVVCQANIIFTECRGVAHLSVFHKFSVLLDNAINNKLQQHFMHDCAGVMQIPADNTGRQKDKVLSVGICI